MRQRQGPAEVLRCGRGGLAWAEPLEVEVVRADGIHLDYPSPAALASFGKPAQTRGLPRGISRWRTTHPLAVPPDPLRLWPSPAPGHP